LFSQAFFKALSNNQILLVLVRFVTLFNLQGTCRVPQRIQMISHLISFVKLFFQVFSNFFKLSFAGLFQFYHLAALTGDSLIVPEVNLFVNPLF